MMIPRVLSKGRDKRALCSTGLVLIVLVAGAILRTPVASGGQLPGANEAAPDAAGIGLAPEELREENIGFRAENPGAFLVWPLPVGVPRTYIRLIPDSPWTENLLGISDCPEYPPMIDDYWWNGTFYPGQFNTYALPGTTKDQVRFLNFDDTGLFYNFFACYRSTPSWSLPDHAGTDISAANGTEVFAAANSDEIYVVIDQADDYRIRLRHPNVNGSGQTWWTFYVHLSSSYYPVGDPIPVSLSAGQAIGQVGNDHLHFQAAVGPGYYNSEARNLWGIDQAPWGGCLWLDTSLCASPGGGCCVCSKLASSSRAVTWASFAPSVASPVPAAVLAPEPATPPGPFPMSAVVPVPVLSQPSDVAPAAPEQAFVPSPSREEPAPAIVRAPVDPLRDPPVSANYAIPKAVFGSGGGPKSSTSFRLQGTSGQTTGVGYLASTNYQLHSGYWGPLWAGEQPPSADFSGSPTEGPAPLDVTFTNLSSGEYDTCAWTFGDGGTSNSCNNQSHTYQTVGLYTVSLTVTGPGGSDTMTRQDYIDVYGAVHANFTGSPTNGIRPLTVAFTNASIGDFDTCAWTFGDGGTSSSCGNPSHTYNSAGSFTVSLTVSGPGGTDTKTRVDYISVHVPVDASFTGSPRAGIRPLTVAFTNGSTGDFDTCAWTFGDGGTSSNCGNPSHTYNSAGSFTVSLTVSGLGGTDTLTRNNYITVYEPVHADFSGEPRSGPPPLDVAFSNLSTGDFSSSLWDFGDGATSTLTHPSHQYQEQGIYSVSLTVSGLGGTDTEQKASYIHVGSVTNLYLPLIVRDFGSTREELRHRVPRRR